MRNPAMSREVGGVTVTSTDAPHGTVVAHVMGEVDLATNPAFAAGIAAVLGRGPTALVIDLSPTTFLGSVGIAHLVDVGRDATCPVSLVVTPAIRRVLGILGLQDQWPLHDHVTDATA